MLFHRSGFLIYDLGWFVSVVMQHITVGTYGRENTAFMVQEGKERLGRESWSLIVHLEHCPRDRVYSVYLTSSSPNSITQGPKLLHMSLWGVIQNKSDSSTQILLDLKPSGIWDF